MSVDLEFAIKQDIRNNPVVREVDAVQRREFFRLLGGAAAVLITLLVILWPRLSQQRQSYRMEYLREELAKETQLNRKYILELETMLRPQILEQRATDLGMILPSENDTVILERVAPSPRPNRGIVAAR
jgi:Tfp pilus assembly protein PilN